MKIFWNRFNFNFNQIINLFSNWNYWSLWFLLFRSYLCHEFDLEGGEFLLMEYSLFGEVFPLIGLWRNIFGNKIGVPKVSDWRFANLRVWYWTLKFSCTRRIAWFCIVWNGAPGHSDLILIFVWLIIVNDFIKNYIWRFMDSLYLWIVTLLVDKYISLKV